MIKQIYQIGDTVEIALRVLSIEEFDNGYSRKESHRIRFKDEKGADYIWETSGKFDLTVDKEYFLKLKVKIISKAYSGTDLIYLKR